MGNKNNNNQMFIIYSIFFLIPLLVRCQKVTNMASDILDYKEMKLAKGNNLEKVIEMEEKLFPWFNDHHSLNSFKENSMINGKGIVMTVGDFYFPYAVHNIKILRSLGCDLPIEIFHGGKDDLSEDKKEYFEKIDGVKVINIYTIYDSEKIILQGYDYKAFSIVASSFKEVLFIDADVVFLTNPSSLFETEEYKKKSAIFFHDRFINFRSAGEAWLNTFMPKGREYSLQVKNSPFWKKESRFLLESGVMVFNKENHWFGLLMALKLNTGDGKKQMGRHTYGDKETFWIALELMGEDYHYYDVEAGMIGIRQNSSLRGNIIHCHPNGKIFWIQGGIVVDKHNKGLKNVVNRFTHMTDPSLPYEWKNFNAISPLIPISKDEKHLIYEFGNIFEVDPLMNK